MNSIPSTESTVVPTPSLAQLFSGRIGKHVRAIADWRKRGQLGKAAQHKRRRSGARMEMLEPRILLSADSVLGAGATAAIIDGFTDYSFLIQNHIDDNSTDFDTLVPGILLTQRDTNGVGGIDDDDRHAKFRDAQVEV